MISLALQTASSYPGKPLNRNKHSVIKSFREIMSFKDTGLTNVVIQYFKQIAE